MSIISSTTVSCSSCAANGELKVYRSINVSEDPSLKEKVLDGSLFVWSCPSCGRMNLTKYETLYHDPEKKLMVWLIPEGELDKSQSVAIRKHAEAMGGYELRRVDSVGDLIEKILLRDAGLEDTVVELCKYVTRAEMATNAQKQGDASSDFANLPIHFHALGEQDGEKFLTLSFPYEGKMAGCNIGFNVYEDCQRILQRNPSIKTEEGFAKVDAGWLSEYL